MILNGGLTPIHDRRISKSDLKVNAVSIENGKKDAVTPTFSLVEGSVSYIFSFILKDKLGFNIFLFILFILLFGQSCNTFNDTNNRVYEIYSAANNAH